MNIERIKKLNRLRILGRVLALVFCFIDVFAVLLWFGTSGSNNRSEQAAYPVITIAPLFFFFLSVGCFVWAMNLRKAIKDLRSESQEQ